MQKKEILWEWISKGIDNSGNDVFTLFECSESLTADLNSDCFVDIKDFALLCQQWLQGGNPYNPAWRGSIPDRMVHGFSVDPADRQRRYQRKRI